MTKGQIVSPSTFSSNSTYRPHITLSSIRAEPTAVSFLPVIIGPIPPNPPGCNTYAYNACNCSDIDNQSAAQACYLYCLDLVGIDIRQLDGDNDGIQILPPDQTPMLLEWPRLAMITVTN